MFEPGRRSVAFLRDPDTHMVLISNSYRPIQVCPLLNFRTLRDRCMTAQKATPSSCMALTSILVSSSPCGVWSPL